MLLPGSTRSANRREYLLQTPDTMVRTPLPGLANGVAIVHTAPEMGAQFAMMTVELGADSLLTHAPAQRFLYVLQGEVFLSCAERGNHLLLPGSFAFVPEAMPHTLHSESGARVVSLEKPEQSLDAGSPARLLVGHEEDTQSSFLNEDPGIQVRSLLPATPEFDFAVNTMTYIPGASLSQVEIHYMEHGLLMLEGEGIYRLGEDWHPVGKGDVIWMAPFCPQWFGALGKGNAKYLIYKNFNRHVLA